MTRKAAIPQTDAARDIAAMAKKSRRGAHLSSLSEHTRPASGIPASGIPAMGAGYGGPASGAGKDLSDPETHVALTPERIADKNATRARLRAMYERFADDETLNPVIRMMAADKLLDRLEGKPANLNVNLDGDDLDRLSDDDLRAEAERLADQIADAKAREGAAKAKPGGLPH